MRLATRQFGGVVVFLVLLLFVGRVFATPFPPTLPTSGYKTGEIIAHIPGEARAVTVQGNIAYVGFENELNIIDVTNKKTARGSEPINSQ